MPMITLGNNYATLSAMITPALFMTATGSLIISTSNRMSRIVDRIRVLVDLSDKIDIGPTTLDYLENRRAHLSEEMRHLEWRSDRVRIALTMLYLSMSTFVGTSLTLAVDALLGSPLYAYALPTTLAMLGVVMLLAASVNLTREAHRALQSNRNEVRFHRKLQEFRRSARAGQG